MAEAGTLELVESLAQLDFEPACEWVVDDDAPDCPEPARWLGRARCCGWDALCCDAHHAEVSEGQRTDPESYFCLECDAEPCLVDFTPLGGSRG